MSLLIALLGCGVKSPTVTLGTPEPLPLLRTSIDRRWYVPVAVNGEPWVWFVDTGYGVTTCDDDLAEELGMELERKAVVRGENGKLDARFALLPDFEIGGHTVHGLTCVVRDLDLTSSIRDPDEVQVAGVLGIDVFRQFLMELDPEAAELRLLPPGSAVVEGVPLRSKPWDRRVRVPLDVGGKTVWPHVDTGTSALYLDGDRLRLKPVTVRHNVVVRGTGVREQVRDIKQYQENLGFAGVELEAMVVNGRRGLAGTEGLVGLSLLSRFKIRFDFAEKRASFEPARWSKIPMWTEWRSAERMPEHSQVRRVDRPAPKPDR